MPTTLLLAHPDLKTYRHLCNRYLYFKVVLKYFYLGKYSHHSIKRTGSIKRPGL